MTALEIQINHQCMGIVGLSNTGVLTALVSMVRKDHEEITFGIGGLDSSSNEHIKWLENHQLSIGDEIQIRIVESAVITPPGRKLKDDPNVVRLSKEECVRRYAAEKVREAFNFRHFGYDQGIQVF